MLKVAELTERLKTGLEIMEALGGYNPMNLALRKKQDDAIKTFRILSNELSAAIVAEQHGLNEVEKQALIMFRGTLIPWKGVPNEQRI